MSPVKSIEEASKRGGVPVLNLPSLNPNLARVFDKPIDAFSPILPAG